MSEKPGGGGGETKGKRRGKETAKWKLPDGHSFLRSDINPEPGAR